MSFQEDIMLMVKNMEVDEAKKLLASIFLKLQKVNNYDYSKENAYEDIKELYREAVVGKMMFGE
ncbi:hypothetical protein [Neobacillus cucumis]|uniref:Uncharacterized protein n=1 Tax=Neobacillus cucumis TaxID=1740721 RepID=A0A2N5HCB1_9BACI|nr:hypothetical protein [Neobacillus cucumis]PLS03154.1 hypothetical protein CVD27_15960 [Neobacillus cucumis]